VSSPWEDEISSVFRSSFPDVETTDFRTRAWKTVPHPDLRTYFPTVLHAFAAAAKLGQDVGITLLPEEEGQPEEHRSYATLYAQSRSLCAALQRRGVQPGDRILVVMATSFEFVLSFFAILRAGAIPVPSYPPAALERAEVGLERLAHVATHAGATFCLTQQNLYPLLGELALTVKSLRALETVESLLKDKPTQPQRASLRGGMPAFIQYTSGSTSAPKGVLLSHRSLVSNVHAAGRALEIRRSDRLVSWLPLYHDMGLIGGVLFSMYWRIPLVLMSPMAFLMRPSRWLWTIHEHRGTLSQAPSFAYAMCVKRMRPSEREGLDLSSWRIALNGAEPVNPRVIRDFEEAFGPHGFQPSAMYPCYGLAESTVAVTFSRPGKPRVFRTVDRQALAQGRVEDSSGRNSISLVGVGRQVPGHRVRVVDAEGEDVSNSEVGHIVVSGPSVMLGYYENPEATDKVLRNGWLWTGDLGFFDQGELFVTGRAKDLIIVRGKNFYAEDLERSAERIEGVRPGGAVAFGVYDEAAGKDLVVMVCETKEKAEVRRSGLVTALSESIREQFGLSLDQIVLVPPGTVPKTSSGKKQRSACRQLYLEENLVPRRTGGFGVAKLFIRSGAGFVSLLRRKVMRSLRSPE
jgi:fatty-acyl-CoA synthase